jgi:ribonucleoside-diphosphate reductase beta chain
MGLFTPRIAYKPFEFPEYYTEGWLKQAQAFWLHTEISMQSDIKDWNEKLNEKEKNLVGNILLGFAQTECAVSDYWTQKVVKCKLVVSTKVMRIKIVYNNVHLIIFNTPFFYIL